MSATKWTDERKALMRTLYPVRGASTATLDAINALHGRPVLTIYAIKHEASVLGLKLTKATHLRRMKEGMADKQAALGETTPSFANGFLSAPLLAPPPPPEELSPAEQAAIADAARERKHAKALAMLSKRNADPQIVASTCRVKLREVFMLAGRIRMGLV